MEFCKNETKSMEIEMRPEAAARRRKPCSKIEAKLLSRRRSKLENEEKSSSPSLEELSKNSSSESDISPRLFTSKQHVELVTFDSQKMISSFPKDVGNLAKKSAKYANKTRDNSTCKISASCSKTHKSSISKSRSYNLFGYSNKNLTNLEASEKLDGGSSLMEIHSNKDLRHLSIKAINESHIPEASDVTKKRSRSAPCTPLFKIKCAKDKYPRDSLIDVKNLAANEIRDKFSNSRAPLHLRLSRSGEVSISSCDQSSNERIIERTTSREAETDNAFVLVPSNLEKLEKLGAENFGVHSAIDKSSEVEGIDGKEKKSNSDEASEEGKNFPALTNDSPPTMENIVENPPDGEMKEEETISWTAEKPVNRVEEKNVSPRKPAKKREFKWETILEKQHRQSTSCGPKNCQKPSAVCEKVGNNEFKPRTEKTANKNSVPKSCNSFEANRLAAYSAIKEELPRLFIKRQISDAMKNKKKEIEGREKMIRESNHSNVPIRKKPDIAAQIVEYCANRADRTKQEICRSKKSFSKHSPQNNIRPNKSTNIDESEETQRPSILKRRKTPSPRRVTFRLPGRVIDDEKLSGVRNNRLQHEAMDSEHFYEPLEQFDGKIQCHDNVHYFCGNDKLTEHDLPVNRSTQNKSRSFQVTNSLKHKGTKSISPRYYTVGEQENYHESEGSEQDWETPTSEDTYRAPKDVQFPKETREAMNILRTAKANVQCDHFDHSQKMERNVERSFRNRQAASHRNQNLPIASSYAVALAKFQERCDDEGGLRSTSTTRQDRASRNANVAVEFYEKGDLKAGIKKYSGNINSETFRACKSGNSRNQLKEDSTKFQDILACHDNTRTMQSNGSESGVSENGIDRTGWTVGLINGKYKYLTAETFGFKINANGASLKKKQLWTLEGSEHQVFLRSHLDRYLAVDQFGNVTCEAEDPSDPGCAFQIQLTLDGSGKWALKNVQRGYFLGSSQDELKCVAKAPGEAEFWLVHLAARPQVNLRSAGRKRFAHLSASQDEIHVDAPVPWGEDTLFTLEFRAAATADNESGNRQGGKTEGGHYALHTCNNKYLANDGKLLDTCTRECLYTAEFHAGLLALRHIYGAYLAPIGSKAVLKSRSTTVTRDELFSLEESLPQASFVAALNQRYVSVKQGVDVTANQDEISGHETFQLEFDRVTKRWYVRTMQDRYWSLEAGGGIQASDHKRSSNALFDLVWQSEGGTVSLRANNGKFLATKRSGHLYANADSPDSGDSDASKYYFYLMNRPILVLRCEQGFVGPKSAASPKLECNKAGYETIRVERCERGVVRFKGQNGKYWYADSEGVSVDSDAPSAGFYLELREPSRLCIKCTDGRYLTAGKNGALRLGETDHDSATKWEF